MTDQPCTPQSTTLDDEAVEATVRLLSAVAHPARLVVLLTLGRQGPMSAGALARLAGVEQSAMSHQLRVLRDARLITAERDGKRVIYQLADHHVAHIVEDALSHASEDVTQD
ncbi:MAG: helix-turn-helix transcriptional regulator [Alphaproteobacteria bacterium]|nr:helix-turn-helix transcriptional regulator [Alphaproteobacteria bacterium]